MGNLSCVSCRSKDEKRLDKSLSELGLGDFKGASFTEEVLNIAKSKAAGEHDEYVATPQQQEAPPSPKITANNLGISDFKGAHFTNDVKDESPQSPDDVALEKTSSNVRFSAHSMRKNSLTELEQIVRQQKIKSRRLTCPKGYGHGDITPSRGVIPARDLPQQEDEEEEDVELSPAEVTAKVIVDISLYLTTQVIYPAYMRYLKEDKPDEYLTYLEETERSSTELEAREHPEAGDQANRPLTEHPG